MKITYSSSVEYFGIGVEFKSPSFAAFDSMKIGVASTEVARKTRKLLKITLNMAFDFFFEKLKI